MDWMRGRRRGLFALLAVAFIAAPSASTALGSATRSDAGVVNHALTDVSGVIRADETWTRAESPYLITGQVIVEPSVTLTIEPGVEVRVADGISFVIRGNLIAHGTLDAPISISGASATPGSWPGIEALGGGPVAPRVSLRRVTLSGGGGSGGRGDQLYGYLAALDLEDTTVRDGAGVGITVETGTLRMRGGAITANAGEAIVVTGLHVGGADEALDVQGVSINANGSNVVVLVGGGSFNSDARLLDLGVPYEFRGQIVVDRGTTVTLDPGVEIQFANQSELVVGGTLEAVGTQAAPIVFRGVADGPGTWFGIRLIGGQINEAAVGRLERVTIQGAGQFGRTALAVTNGRLEFIGGAISQAAGDGILVDGGAWPGTSRIENSALADIAGIGVGNDTTAAVIARNNWWGDPSGPSSDAACTTGTGTPVHGLVRTAPWLTGANQKPDPFAAPPFPVITLSPQRWYAPADGQTRIWVDLTLRDAQGRPLPGRHVDLHATLGEVATGGLTDAAGQTRAWLVASEPGDSELTAVLADTAACEPAEAGEALVTFFDAEAGLVAGMQAPYLYDGMEVTPQPIMVGVETTVRARLTNPNATPIKVEVEFGYADFGIGLTFGPIGKLLTGEIPANGEATFETPWLPPISGHYCLEVRYRIVGTTGWRDGATLFAGVGLPPGWRPEPWDAQSRGGGRGGLNLNTYGSPPANGGGSGGQPNRDGANRVVGGFRSLGFGQPADIIGGLKGDPPRQDYDLVAAIERGPVQYWPREAGWSDTRWAAEQALADALFEFSAIGNAAIVSLDRYGGATAAQELRWAAVQASSLLHYHGLLGSEAIVVADRIRDLVAIIERESPDEGMSLAEATADLDRIRTRGFDAAEIALARAMGADDAGLERIKAWALRQTPADLAGRTTDQLRKVEAYYREIGPWLEAARMFPDASGPSAANGSLTAADVPSRLAAIRDATTSFQIGNPLEATATIDLRSRPLSLPPGWTVTLLPAQVTLEPGATASISVTIVPSGPAVQGTVAKVAVEGVAAGEVLGGVVFELVVPEYVPFESLSPSPGPADSTTLVIIGAAAAAALVLIVGLFLLLRRRTRVA